MLGNWNRGTIAEDHWLVVEPYPSGKYEFVNGKDDIPYIYISIYDMENKIHVWNHQPDQDSSDVVLPAHETELQHLRICIFLRKKINPLVN